MKELVLSEGKYKIVFADEGFPTKALRYDEEWRDLIGDNLIGALCSKIEELEEKGTIK